MSEFKTAVQGAFLLLGALLVGHYCLPLGLLAWVAATVFLVFW